MNIITTKTKEEGIQKANEILSHEINGQTVLFLSGGSTPKPLYEKIAKDRLLKVGAVGVVDERYGEEFHENSNEKMIKDTGLLNFLDTKNIPFYKILKGKDIKETSKDYDETLRFLFFHFKKTIGILGVGEDGHIAGLPPGIQNLRFKIQNEEMAVWLENFPGEHKQRITMSYRALSMLDLIIVLVFGKEKKKTLQKMLKEDSIEEVPARFLTQKKISEKTILITDSS